MPVFEYKGLDSGGKPCTGLVDAESSKVARQKLRKQGVFTTDIFEGKGAGGGGLRQSSVKGAGKALSVEVDLSKYFNPIGVTDVALMTRQLAALLGA